MCGGCECAGGVPTPDTEPTRILLLCWGGGGRGGGKCVGGGDRWVGVSLGVGGGGVRLGWREERKGRGAAAGATYACIAVNT